MQLNRIGAGNSTSRTMFRTATSLWQNAELEQSFKMGPLRYRSSAPRTQSYVSALLCSPPIEAVSYNLQASSCLS